MNNQNNMRTIKKVVLEDKKDKKNKKEIPTDNFVNRMSSNLSFLSFLSLKPHANSFYIIREICSICVIRIEKKCETDSGMGKMAYLCICQG